jgi:hypothetical protein
MKTLLALSFALSFSSVFADTFEIPKDILDRHVKACPEFTEPGRGEYLTREKYTLPGSEYSKESRTLYLLGCEMYAYNSREKAYIVTPYETIDVSVAEIDGKGSITATDDLMGAGFDQDTLTLGTFQLGRGMGDCGSAASYKYDPMYERFILVEARLKEECDGQETDWPIIYKK